MRHFQVTFFGDVTDDVSDDVNNDLVPRVMLGGNAKNVGNQFGDVENQVGNLGKAVEIK